MRYRPIRRNAEFGRVYARGKSYVNPALVLYVLKTRGKKTRVGLTATKKIGHAVQRNRARRVMKAAIDEHLDYNIGGYDLIFVARGMTPRLKSWQLSSVVAKLFAQAGLPDKAKQPGAKPPATVPRPAGRKASEPALGMVPPCPVRAHPLVSEVDQPGTGAQLPFYPLLQPVCHRGHPDPRLHQGAAAGRCPHCPVQPAGPLGLRPRAGARPLAQPGPEAFSGQTVFHKTRKISGKQTSP